MVFNSGRLEAVVRGVMATRFVTLFTTGCGFKASVAVAARRVLRGFGGIDSVTGSAAGAATGWSASTVGPGMLASEYLRREGAAQPTPRSTLQ